MKKQEIASSAISIIENEAQAWRDGTNWVTSKVFENTREVIEQARKNFLGVFENPINPITGQEKEWIPQTEVSVDNATKSSDVDTKAINIISTNPSSVRLTSIVRAELKYLLYYIKFGEKLNLFIRTLCIDGTAIWKTVEEEKDGYFYPRVMPVDMLNFYIDPTAESIEEAVKNSGVIERSVISRKGFESYDWINKDKVQFTTKYAAKNENLSNNDAGTTEYIEIFERWGIFPEYLITGLKKDTSYVNGRIVASKGNGGYVVHFIGKEDSSKCPYEESWFVRIMNRWRGRGIPEKLFYQQLALNRTVNTRATRAQIAQAGLWTVKKGKGIKQENMTNLTSKGAIFVNDHEDIQQLQVQDVPVSSYKDEENSKDWSRANTSAYESSTGESMAASMPATNAAIQKQAVASTFDLIKQNIEMFLERWIRNQVFPIAEKNLTKGKIVRLTGEITDLDEFDKDVATKLAFNKYANSWSFPTLEDMQKEVQSNVEKLKTYKDSRYVEIVKSLKISDFDVRVSVSNEADDVNIMTQRLVQMMSVAPEYRDTFVKEALDLMGIDTASMKPKPTPEQQAEMMKATGEQPPQDTSSTQEYTDANTATYNTPQ